MINYEEKIKKLKEEADKLEAVANIIETLKTRMEWDSMEYIEDDSEEGHHFEAPNEEYRPWQYRQYVAFNEVIELIEKHYFK